MTIHKEGVRTILIIFALLTIINAGFYYFTGGSRSLSAAMLIVSALFLLQIIYFFRKPAREIIKESDAVLAPADGTIVAIEEIHENEYFRGNRIQVSIFMSVFNMHMNLYPVGGKISYYKYHPGKHLVACHPKSSTLNERTSTVIRPEKGEEVLVRQIAGGLARRIVSYANAEQSVEQGSEMGFIKFGSRVDVFLPPGTIPMVNMGQKVKAGVTVIAPL